MEILTYQQFMALIKDDTNKVLRFQQHEQYPKLISTCNNEYIKIFINKKKIFTKDHFLPRAKQFFQNSERLKAVGLKGPEILQFAFCPELKMHLLRYQKIPGISLRDLLKTKYDEKILVEVMQYMNLLHDKGIFFRSIHLDNIIYSDEKEFYLIDITDVRFKKSALNAYLRYRNLKHLLFHPEDRTLWSNERLAACIMHYLAMAKMNKLAKFFMWHRLNVLAKYYLN